MRRGLSAGADGDHALGVELRGFAVVDSWGIVRAEHVEHVDDDVGLGIVESVLELGDVLARPEEIEVATPPILMEKGAVAPVVPEHSYVAILRDISTWDVKQPSARSGDADRLLLEP